MVSGLEHRTEDGLRSPEGLITSNEASVSTLGLRVQRTLVVGVLFLGANGSKQEIIRVVSHADVSAR